MRSFLGFLLLSIFSSLASAELGPNLTSISPNSGPLAGGNQLTLTGTNFREGLSVLVGGIPCTAPTFKSAKEATCVVPMAKGGAGSRDVTLSNRPMGRMYIPPSTLKGAYTYQVGPSLTSVSPASGALAGGTLLTLKGSGFLAGLTVTVGESPCTDLKVSSTEVTCKTPSGSAGAKAVKLANPDGQSANRPDAYTYREDLKLSTVSPTEGALAGGTLLTLKGSGFLAGLTVTVGGSPCTDLTVSSTEVTCKTPSGTAGAKAIVLANPDGQSANRPDAYTYKALPALLAVDEGVSLIFPETRIGNESTLTIRIKNSGEKNASSIYLSFPPAPFSLGSSKCDKAVLAPNSSCTFEVKFKPFSEGKNEFTLFLTYADGGAERKSVDLVPSGMALRALSPANVSIVEGTSYSFSDIPAGSAPVTKTFTLKNSGETAAEIAFNKNTLATEKFKVDKSRCPDNDKLNANSSCTFDVTLTTTPGDISADFGVYIDWFGVLQKTIILELSWKAAQIPEPEFQGLAFFKANGSGFLDSSASYVEAVPQGSSQKLVGWAKTHFSNNSSVLLKWKPIDGDPEYGVFVNNQLVGAWKRASYSFLLTNLKDGTYEVQIKVKDTAQTEHEYAEGHSPRLVIFSGASTFDSRDGTSSGSNNFGDPCGAKRIVYAWVDSRPKPRPEPLDPNTGKPLETRYDFYPPKADWGLSSGSVSWGTCTSAKINFWVYDKQSNNWRDQSGTESRKCVFACK